MSAERVCGFPDCELPHLARGYCNSHYKQWSRGSEMRPLRNSATIPRTELGRWWPQAECLDSGVSFDHPSDENKALCAACPVRSECLESAMFEEGSVDFTDRFMVRGGLSPLARHRLAVERGWAEPARSDSTTLSECVDCHAQLIPSRAWLLADKDQREAWWDEGRAKAGGYDRCDKHATAYKRRMFGRPSRAQGAA